MKNIKIILLNVLIVLSMISCSELEEVYIFHEPYLNIYANVSVADPGLNFVHVYRTTGYGEPDRYELDSILYHEFYNESSGDTITYQTFYIDTVYSVNDAKVYFLHEGDTIRFYERMQGIYHLVDTNTVFVIGDVYELYVETEDYDLATSSELALSPIAWDNDPGDTVIISLSDPRDTLFWSNIGGAYNVNFYYTYRSEWGGWSYTYEFESASVREPFWAYDTSNYDIIFNPDPFYDRLYGEYSDTDTLELTVTVVAYSDSYLDYTSLQQMAVTTGFIRYPTINDFRVNIDNALGAFTSMSISDERTVLFIR